YPWLLGSCGHNVVFGQNVVLRHPHKIHIGSNVVVDDNCLIDAKGDSNRGIRIGDGVFVGRNTILSCKNGDIDVADGANLGFNCEVFSASRVTIGARVLMAAYTSVIGGDHDFSDTAKPAIVAAARESGHDARLVITPDHGFGRQAAAYWQTWRFDISHVDGMKVDQVISLRYPSYAVRHPAHVCWLNHPMHEYYDLWPRL